MPRLASSVPDAHRAPWVLATRSVGKQRELQALLHADGVRVETLDDAGIPWSRDEDGIEIYESFEENALAKARWFAQRLPGRMVLADDSGLCVEALGGAPGVHSKRWAGYGVDAPPTDDAQVDAANNAALLHALALASARGETSRRAAYVCVAVCVGPTGEWMSRGETEGEIVLAPSGAQGFGYDPLFWSTELSATFANVSREAKSRVSHRGRAFSSLLSAIRATK